MTISFPPPPRLFASDNAAGAHPAVIAALVAANSGHVLAYGQDSYTKQAKQLFNQLFDADVRTEFVYGGTGANVLALACMLQPAEAVVCSSWAHIATDETGAPERILGAKLIDLQVPDAKLRPEDIRAIAVLQNNVHHAQPRVVSLTQVTELGTVYTPQEVHALCQTAHEFGMYVHMDGARLANAAAIFGGNAAALRSFTIDAGVDVLSFGGTKAGVVFGEAVVFLNSKLGQRVEYIRKQVTQLHSKMRFISAQYIALLQDDLFFKLGIQANNMATELYEKTKHLSSLGLTAPPAANSMFPILTPASKTLLQDWSFFWDWDIAKSQVRWMTAWDVTPQDIDIFVKGIGQAISS